MFVVMWNYQNMVRIALDQGQLNGDEPWYYQLQGYREVQTVSKLQSKLRLISTPNTPYLHFYDIPFVFRFLRRFITYFNVKSKLYITESMLTKGITNKTTLLNKYLICQLPSLNSFTIYSIALQRNLNEVSYLACMVDVKSIAGSPLKSQYLTLLGS